jgi:TolB-like protein
VVLGCLRKSPAERFQTVADLRATLELASGTPVEKTASIAVLPFANMSRDADDEYFSDGLGEEIINALTQIAGLIVIARTSAFRFQGQERGHSQDWRDARGTNVLEGSVRRAGSGLRVTASLSMRPTGHISGLTAMIAK